jgi:hypothetical protein
VIRTKQYIALPFSLLAMLALLLHGIIPHHHHNAEAEKCNLEEHYAALHHAEISSTFTTEVCSNDQHSNEQQAHVCTLNVAASKQISVTLFAVISSCSFIKKVSGPEVHFLQYSEHFIPSTSPEVRSLRAPPLV